MRSNLEPLQQTEPRTDAQLFEMKKKGWKESGTLVVTKRQREKLSMTEHDAVISIGNKLYGGKK